MEILKIKEQVFFNLIFHVNIASALTHGVRLGSYHFLMRQNFDSVW